MEKIIETAQGICNTPADCTSFTEKAIALCSTEYKVLVKLRDLKESTEQEKNEFKTADISYVEELVNLVNIDGETVPMARIWVKKKSIGAKASLFIVDDTTL